MVTGRIMKVIYKLILIDLENVKYVCSHHQLRSKSKALWLTRGEQPKHVMMNYLNL